MALIAGTYVSATQFTVANDLTSDFVPGTALYMDCGVDGVKYGFVDYSSYSSPNTTIYLESNESQSITSNLTGCYFSRVKQKRSDGNMPMQYVISQRGHKSGMALSYKSSSDIYIDSGSIHLDNGTQENIYYNPNQITKQLTSLSVSTWYGIYVKPPSNGITISGNEIDYAPVSSAPTKNQAKRGWYHPSNAGWRCIGFVKSNSSSVIVPFNVQGARVLLEGLFPIYTGNPSSTWATVTADVPVGNISAIWNIASNYQNTGSWVVWRKKGSSGFGHCSTYTPALTGAWSNTQVVVSCDSSKQAEVAIAEASTNTIYVLNNGFVLDDWM